MSKTPDDFFFKLPFGIFTSWALRARRGNVESPVKTDHRRLEVIMLLLLKGASYLVWVCFNPLSELVGSKEKTNLKKLRGCCLGKEQRAAETRLTLLLHLSSSSCSQWMVTPCSPVRVRTPPKLRPLPSAMRRPQSSGLRFRKPPSSSFIISLQRRGRISKFRCVLTAVGSGRWWSRRRRPVQILHRRSDWGEHGDRQRTLGPCWLRRCVIATFWSRWPSVGAFLTPRLPRRSSPSQAEPLHLSRAVYQTRESCHYGHLRPQVLFKLDPFNCFDSGALIHVVELSTHTCWDHNTK